MFLNINNIPASQVLVQHFALWVGLLGAVLASRENKLYCSQARGTYFQRKNLSMGKWVAKLTTFFVLISLAWGSWELVKIEMEYPVNIAPGIPRWLAQLIMPLGFGLIAFQVYINSYEKHIHKISLLIFSAILVYSSYSDFLLDTIPVLHVGTSIILIALFYGSPIFVGLGGLVVLLFLYDYTPISAIPAEAYRIVVSPTLPTIPLFTLAGYILAESRASERLVKVFRELFGWCPGGTPVVIILLCGFFTALTGGSGVTILALGGLLLPLFKEGYSSKNFSLGPYYCICQ